MDAQFMIGYTTAFDRYNDFQGARTDNETVTPGTIRQALQVALDNAPPGMEPPTPIIQRIAQVSAQLQTTPASSP
ncbi:MAG TPA: hypothetical protein PK634_04940 [Kiritimatiellia bacterium]|nr:hypothetical protein [Kiritimatiellia bacterium]